MEAEIGSFSHVLRMHGGGKDANARRKKKTQQVSQNVNLTGVRAKEGQPESEDASGDSPGRRLYFAILDHVLYPSTSSTRRGA